jgi:hypothetical protein
METRQSQQQGSGEDELDIEQTGRHLVTALPMIRDQLL